LSHDGGREAHKKKQKTPNSESFREQAVQRPRSNAEWKRKKTRNTEHRTSNAKYTTRNVQAEQTTPNTQRPTSNAQWQKVHLAFLSAVRILEKKILMSSSVSVRIEDIFEAGIMDDLATSRSQRRVSFSSFKQTFSLWIKSSRDSAASTRNFHMEKSHSEAADQQDDWPPSYLADCRQAG
jgi:hypothetical protein